MSMTSAAAAYFDQAAGEWDQIRSGYFTEAVREAAIAHAYLRPEMAVADVGSGTGFMADGLAPLVSHVYALDGSPAMLEQARRNLAGHANVTYHLSDGSSLPLPAASVDAVFANMYLHHCPDPLAAIREMTRLLRPGGRLVITDLDRHDHAWMRDEMADEWLGFERSQIKAWLREAGLVNVLVDCTSQSCCATSRRTQAGDSETAATSQRAEISVFVAVGGRRVVAREAVQANYAAVAEGVSCGCGSTVVPDEFVADIALSPGPATSSCCAPSNAMPLVVAAPDGEAVSYDTGYSAEQLAQAPAEAAAISLGCGNPSALAALRPGETVLDIGSGGGIDAFFATRQVGPTGLVIGLDMTPSMIERARRTAAAVGLGNVEFRLGQAEAMPVEDGSIDAILSNCVINLCEDKGRVFEEAFRVLKPGGRLSISDMVTDGALPPSLRGDGAQWGGCISGALPEREYLDLVSGAGFTDVVGQRGLSGGELAGVAVYSLSVSARKA
jgi:ubiquinone/menaquinone biosynthesis C-methylase UbiE